MKAAIATVVLAGVVAAPAFAQSSLDRYGGPNQGGRYSADAQGVPPGHLPPPGQCRVWYDGRPPGHQPAPTNCRQAERVARNDRYARVIYGGDRGWFGSDDRRAVRRPDPRLRFPDRGYPYDDESRSVPYAQGYRDGRDKGHDDRSDDKRYDPTRHGRYKDADRGYERRYGDKDDYRVIYRDGFRAGYSEGYRGVLTTRSER